MTTQTVSAPMSAPVQSPQTAQVAPETGFAEMLYTLTGGAQAAQNMQTAQSGQSPTWRDMQATQSRTAQAQSAMGTLSGLDMANDVQQGGLMKILMALMQQAKGVTGLDDEKSEGSLELIAKFQEMMRKLQGAGGEEMVGQQMLAMLASMLGGQLMQGNLMAANGAQDPLLMQGTDAGAQMQNLLETLMNGTPEQALRLLTGDTEQAFEALIQALQTAQAQSLSEAQDIPVTAVSVQRNQGAEAPEMVFQSNIRAAKEQLAQADTVEGQRAELNLDELQNRVDKGVHLQNTGIGAAAAAVNTGEAQGTEGAPAPIATQVVQGVQRGIVAGEEQINIKLAPEGLGDITVRITKTADGITTLHLIAKSAETRAMLESEIGTLRETLSPMRVQVGEVMTEQQEAMLNQQQNFHEQRRQNSWREMRGAPYYGDEPLQSDETAQAIPAAQVPQSALNAVI